MQKSEKSPKLECVKFYTDKAIVNSTDECGKVYAILALTHAILELGNAIKDKNKEKDKK